MTFYCVWLQYFVYCVAYIWDSLLFCCVCKGYFVCNNMYVQGTLSYVLCMCENVDIKNLHVSSTLYLECGCAKLLPPPPPPPHFFLSFQNCILMASEI